MAGRVGQPRRVTSAPSRLRSHRRNTSTLYAFTYGGTVLESTNGGTTWSAPGTGLPSTICYCNSELVVDPSNPAHVLVATPVNQAAFVAKLNSTGSALLWSTYLGGTSSTNANAVATNGTGDAFVTGYNGGGGFPVTSSALPAGTFNDAFITEISDATAACSTLTVNPGSVTISPFGQTLTFEVSPQAAAHGPHPPTSHGRRSLRARPGPGRGSLPCRLRITRPLRRKRRT